MENSIYNLIQKAQNSDAFYDKLELFTTDKINIARDKFSIIVQDYSNFIQKNSLEPIRTNEEYIFELISIGLFWRLYISNAISANKSIELYLAFLIAIRNKIKPIKPLIDSIRGILATKHLLNYSKNSKIDLNFVNLLKLQLWLRATGEFKQEVKRFRNWIKFFALNTEKLLPTLEMTIEFSYKFDFSDELSDYFAPVNSFLTNQKEVYHGREDIIFTGRKPQEYLLSVFGAELMNIAWRSDFKAAEKKALLVPACMKIYADKKCKAKKIDLDFACRNCSNQCAISKLTLLGKENDFEVFIIPHSSDFSRWLKKWSGSGYGIIASACVLNLITGGYEAKALDIPIQCVFLDYCGCKAHWSKDGFPTNLNSNRILKILNA